MNRSIQTEEFLARFCEWRRVAPRDFHAYVLKHALYPHARLLRPLLRRLAAQHFQADHDFIEDVSHVRNAADFTEAVQIYVDHYSNRRFLRQQLRLRISVRRMWLMVREVLPEDPPSLLARTLRSPDTFTPFRSAAGPDGVESSDPNAAGRGSRRRCRSGRRG